ncbi:hypothetical protein AB0I91_18905 [Actinosynnema sp. NPDC049800]
MTNFGSFSNITSNSAHVAASPMAGLAHMTRQLHADQHERQIDRRIADLEH